MTDNQQKRTGGKPGLAPRRVALALIHAVTIDQKTLAEVAPDPDLAPDERARAQRLALSTLRWSPRADRMIGPYLRQRPPDEVLNLLRLATTELCLDGAPAHGVVDASVTLAKAAPETRRQSGLVNAVLRKIAVETAKWETLPPPTLPKKLRARLVADWGKDAIAAIEVAHATGAPLDLTPRDGDAAALAALTGGEVLATGSVRFRGAGQVTALPGFADGTWWVQDAAAAIPARVLNAAKGETVLDMCAAPGGKTMQLSATGADVTALDVSEQRLETVRENLARTDLPATIVAADALTFEGGPFDAILLDAPCSATGTIRRHPDLPHAKGSPDISDLLTLQSAMIDRAAALLKPGGRLVFCTCSLFRAEGEDHVAPALARNPSLALDPEALAQPGIYAEWIGPEGLRLRPDFWPDRGGMDGFFITAFRKSADPRD